MARRRRAGSVPARRTMGAPRSVKRVSVALTVMGTLGSFAGCSCGDDSTAETGAGSGGCQPPGCKALEAGLIGAYTSAAVGADGSVWIAGYLEANYNDPAYTYTY